MTTASNAGALRARERAARGRAQGSAATRERRSWLAGIDLVLVVVTMLLCVAGAVAIYAATRNRLQASGGNGEFFLTRDLINIAIGLGLAVAAASVDYRRLVDLAPVAWAGVLVLLLAVLSPLGSTVNGAHAWFSLGPVQFEPSEVAKPVLILLAAGLLTAGGKEGPGLLSIGWLVAATGVPVLLVLAEPALGVSMVLVVILVAALALGGARASIIGGMVATMVLGAVLAFSLHLLKPYQVQRFSGFVQPKAHTTAVYQLEQSKIAIGSGGLTGRGFLGGSQTNGGYVPEQQTDFVFSVVGEEGGFLGAGALLLAFGLFLWRALRIAERAVDQRARIIAGCIAAWFSAQIFINVGMTVGIMPVTGVPLPFVSYGGSALFINLIAVGLLLNVARRAT